ncbi:NADPH-dependent FMN reductase [Actinomycetota bacterium Odt1-20B]
MTDASEAGAARREGATQVQEQDRVAVVIGSTRPARICPDIAAWVRDVAQEAGPLHYELLDLAEVGLPLLDEPLKAALQQYSHEHTRAWSRTVASYTADDDVDDNWQLKDVYATLRPFRDQVRAVDEQMLQALKDGQ